MEIFRQKIEYLFEKAGFAGIIYVNIFSYAIWCEKNVDIVRSRAEDFLQYGIIIEDIITTEQMFDKIKNKCVLETHTDVWRYPKEDTFKWYCNATYSNNNVLLYDDTVGDSVKLEKSNIIYLKA